MFATKPFHMVPSPQMHMRLHSGTRTVHHTHTQQSRKEDLPKKASHTDTSFTLPVRSAGSETYTVSPYTFTWPQSISPAKTYSLERGN